MKTPLLALITCLGCTQAFAGLILEQKVEGTMPASTSIMSIQGGKVRTDIGSDISSVMDTKTGEILSIMHANKQVMVMKNTAGLTANLQANMPEIKPVNTGKKEKVGDYECDIVTMDMMGVKSTFWVCRDYPNWDKIKTEMEALTTTMNLGSKGLPSELDGMILKTVSEGPGFNSTTTVVSVKIEDIDAAKFKSPDGYQVVEVPQQPAVPAQ